MKRFKFRLQAIYKLKELERQKVIHKLARLNGFLVKHKSQIYRDKSDIDVSYQDYQKSVQNTKTAKNLSFYPHYQATKRQNIHLHEQEIVKINAEIKIVNQELAKIDNEIKVLDEMRLRDLKKLKKEYNKKEEASLEDLNQMKSANSDIMGNFLDEDFNN